MPWRGLRAIFLLGEALALEVLLLPADLEAAAVGVFFLETDFVQEVGAAGMGPKRREVWIR